MDFHNNSFEEYEEEYDVFYEELKRQVLQLTADDEDGLIYENETPNTAEARRRVTCNGPTCGVPSRWPGIKFKEDCAATSAWALSSWRSGSTVGTGVFIPRNVESRRKNRSSILDVDAGRNKTGRGITYRPVVKME
ncbi:hypothetical protein OROGR_002015 [Orobanche gracilis]